MFPSLNFQVLNVSCAILLLAVLFQAAGAESAFTPFKITIAPQKNESSLLPLLQQTLSKERDRLEQSGITMNDNKLMRREHGTLAKVLKSEGYYGHHIDSDKSAGRINYRIDTGRIYRIGKLSVTSAQTDIVLPGEEQLALHPDMKLRAAKVLAALETLRRFIRDHNCLYQVNTDYEVVLHHDSASADIHFLVKPAPQVKIGNIALQGLETVQESYVHQILGLEQGQCYRTRAIEKARLRLLQTGLFSLVNSSVGSPVDGKVDMHFELKESHHRTIKAGVGFSTDEGVSLTAGWQHRNIFGRAERLEVSGKVSKLFKTIDSTLTFPSFRRPDQALVLEAELATENLDAYNSQGMTVSASLKRKLAHYLTATAGVRYKFKSVQESGGKDTFALFSLPVTLGYDSRDDILDPHNGWASSIALEPFVDTLNPDIMFLKTTLGASIYHTFKNLPLVPTIAARSLVGMINGINTDAVPASERFYAGGGGSVRGFPFQKLGPLDGTNPHGGRSVLEFSVETRFRITHDWGGVVFVDGGNVYDDQYPRFDKGVRLAVGAGARYYTSFAPIRLDIAFPVNRRSGIDDPYQIYISLAQAF